MKENYFQNNIPLYLVVLALFMKFDSIFKNHSAQVK